MRNYILIQKYRKAILNTNTQIIYNNDEIRRTAPNQSNN